MTSTAPYYYKVTDTNIYFPDAPGSDVQQNQKHAQAVIEDSFKHSNPESLQQPPIDVNLLQAVSSAAGQESTLNLLGTIPPNERLGLANAISQTKVAEVAVSLLSPVNGKGKRKRAPELQYQHEEGSQERRRSSENYQSNASPQPSRKRQRKGEISRTVTPEYTAEEQQGSPVASDNLEGDTSFFVSEYPPSLSMSEARAAGVYSAAALFRKPTSASKKYTRPPMSKVFTSLELTPENFLRLQASAKAYMLDPARPERKACVGNRGKGDSDMVKLKLYHCVKQFLEQDEIGEEYFGINSEGSARRKWHWPENLNKVIDLVTPLLRRMVTNERQRQYAIESRKGGGKEKKDLKDGNGHAADEAAENFMKAVRQHADVTTQVDPSLATAAESRQLNAHKAASPGQIDDLSLRIIFIRKYPGSSPQIMASFNQPAIAYSGYMQLVELVEKAMPAQVKTPIQNGVADLEGYANRDEIEPLQEQYTQSAPNISAFSPTKGLVPVTGDDEWSNYQIEARSCVWLENELRIVVDAG